MVEVKIDDIDLIMIKHAAAGDQAVTYYQNEFYRVGFMLDRTKVIPMEDIKGVYYPSEKNGIELLDVESFKKKYENQKSLL